MKIRTIDTGRRQLDEEMARTLGKLLNHSDEEITPPLERESKRE